MDAVALKVQAMIPATNRAGLTNNAIFPYLSARTTSIPAFKLDHSFSAKSKLSYYYSRIKTYTDIGSGGDGLPQPITNVINTTGATAQDRAVQLRAARCRSRWPGSEPGRQPYGAEIVPP